MHKAARNPTAGSATIATVGQAEADTCCAASERPDPYQPSAVVIAAPIVSPLAALAEPPSTPLVGMDWHRPPPLLASRQVPTHLLLSVFLI